MPDATGTAPAPSIDLPNLFAMSAARLNEDANATSAQLRQVGNLSVQQAVENSGRLSAMFGVRAAQTNPIEAASIQTLKAAGSGENAQSNATATALMGLANAFQAIAANLAHATPSSAGSAAASQQK